MYGNNESEEEGMRVGAVGFMRMAKGLLPTSLSETG